MLKQSQQKKYGKIFLGQSTMFWTGPNLFEGLGSKSKIQKWKVIFGPVQHYLDLFWSYLAHIYLDLNIDGHWSPDTFHLLSS